jgi:hypothetical protein
MLIALLLIACSDAPTPPAAAPSEAVDPAGITALLAGPLGVPQTRIDRLRARIGPACAVVIDPADPVGCDVSDDCMATAFSAATGEWGIVAMSSAGQVPAAHRCPDASALQPLPPPAD